MTGTGTQEDQYIVDNWIDFVQATAIKDAYVKFADGGGTINMNEICPDGMTETVTIRAFVDGNGWNIKNIHLNGGYAFNICNKVENLNFTDFNIESSNSSRRAIMFSFDYFTPTGTSENRYGLLYKCAFNGYLTGGYPNMFKGANNDTDRISLMRCSAKLKITENSHLNQSYRVLCNHCVFDIDAPNSIDPFYDMPLNNCLIFGSYKSLTIPGYSKYVIVDAECQSQAASQGGKSELIIGNQDKAALSNNFNAVTTEQLKNPAYLASLGYPIGVD